MSPAMRRKLAMQLEHLEEKVRLVRQLIEAGAAVDDVAVASRRMAQGAEQVDFVVRQVAPQP